MTSLRRADHCYRQPLICCLICTALAGCTVVGPSALRGGRLAYNEAIVETDNQQMLLLAVRNRYLERSNLLAVSSVTANVSVTANTGIELGFGDDDSYSGNLVPFGAGVIYEENPTISYTPVGGELYAHHLLSPLPLSALARLARTRVYPTLSYNALVASVNGIYNPDFQDSDAPPDPRFERFATLMTGLTRAHRLHWINDSSDRERFAIAIDNYSPEFADEVEELVDLLGLEPTADPPAPIVLPVSLALQGGDAGGVAIITRSVYDLLEIFSGAVEVPAQDLQGGAAVSYPPPGIAGRGLRVRYAASEPDHAAVAVRYRGGWFYIDEGDQATKQFFRLLTLLLSVTIAESTATGASAPLLTVPVSR
jgi:hypothetical protein